MRILSPFIAMLALVLSVAAHAAPVRVAAFGFELKDTSGEPTAAEMARLGMLDDVLKQKLTAAGYALVSLTPVAAELKRQDLLDCTTCAADLARQVGASVAVVGWVQKVSNLILNVNLVLRDAKSNQVLRAGSVSIRGNTDESWRRGLDYLLTESIFPPGKALPR